MSEAGALTDGTRTRLLSEEVFECRLEPGAVVAESTLARRFGVSKGPVREALKRLGHMGLVRSLPRVGYMVESVNLADLDEIYLMRIALEPLATELATPRFSDEQLAELERLALVEDAPHEPPERRAAAYARSNDQFHRMIARASGNRRLSVAIGGLLEEVERVLYLLA